jgi:protein-S-isoprenylcysteine O-methyltransferase Ste14
VSVRSIPLLAFFADSALCVLFYLLLPSLNLITPPYHWLGIAPAAVGVYLTMRCHGLFKTHNTSHTFGDITCVLVEGPYRYSRNPMYLGMTLVLLGVAVFSQNVLSLLAPLDFFLVMHFFVIPREEQRLEEEQDEAYRAYTRRVRRWL